MDLTTLWQEHKTFILCVMAGLLLFFVGQAVNSSMYTLDEKNRTVRSLRSNLNKLATPASGQLQEARSTNEDLMGRYESAAGRVGFVPEQRYQLSRNEKPDIQYDRLYNEARDTLVEGAKTLNITVTPDLGMPELSPTRRSEIQKALTALDIVTRVILLCIESNIRLIDSVTMVPDAGRKKKGLLKEQRVRFRLMGTASAVAEFLRRFVLQENFLAIEEAAFQMADKDGASVRADFTVSALTIAKEESET